MKSDLLDMDPSLPITLDIFTNTDVKFHIDDLIRGKRLNFEFKIKSKKNNGL